MSSSRYKPPKEKRPKEEVQENPKAKTPSEKRREWFINFGVSILVLAFLMTSGIVYVNLNQDQPGIPEPGDTPMSAMDAQLAQIDSEIERWNQELATNPDDVTALANLGYYYMQKAQAVSQPPLQDPTATPAPEDGRRDEFLAKAREYLEKALSVDPNYAFAHQQLAETYIAAEQFDEARRQAEAALEAAERPVGPDEDPATAETTRLNEKVQARMLLGRLAAREENWQVALDQLGQAIELKPGETNAYISRALVYRQLEQDARAKQDLEKALDIAQKMSDQQAMILASALLQQMEPAPQGTPTPEATPAATPTPAATTPTPAATPTPVTTATPAPAVTPTPAATP